MACALELRDSRKRCHAPAGRGAPGDGHARDGERFGGALAAVLSPLLDLLLFCLAILGLSILFIEDTSPIFWFSHEFAFLSGGWALSCSLDVYAGAHAGSAFLWQAAALLVCWAALLALSGLAIFQRVPRQLESGRELRKCRPPLRAK